MKRALKSREKAVLKNNPKSDGVSVDPSNDITHKTTRRSGTQAAMIGLAISMGATSLLVTRQSDQAQAAAPVGAQKAASTIPVLSETEIKFAATKLESQAVSSASAPENPVIVEPTAVSQVPGLEAKWPVAAKEVAAHIPSLEANGNAIYLPVSAGEAVNNNSVQSKLQINNKLTETASSTTAVTVETANTLTNEVDQQLKAQQEFALSRLQEKSNRLRNSLAELRSEETKSSSPTEQTAIELTSKPKKVANNNLSTKSEHLTDADQASLIYKLKQDKQAEKSPGNAVTATPVIPTIPTVVAQSISTTYEVKPGDTLAEIATNHGTSVSELVKANNLDDPNRLQISQKLVIPTDKVGQSSYSQPRIAAVPVYNQSNINKKVVDPNPAALSKPDLEANLPEVPETPVVRNNNTVAIPIPVAKENRVTFNPPTMRSGITIPVPVVKNNQLPTQEIPTTASTSNQVGDDKQLVNRLAEKQVPQNQPQTVSKVKGTERIRSLQAEIERLREKYRTQQSDVTVATATEDETAAVPVVVEKNNNNFVASGANAQQNKVAIPVPKPTLPSYKEQPTRLLLSATRPEPINPQFQSNQKSLGNSSSSSSGIRITVPPANMNSNDSLGKLRGSIVSPRSTALPPLAAVDRHLPQAVDPTNNPSKAYIWPAKGVLTSGYGWRWGRMHRGIDVANSTGTPIYASASGVIERAGWNRGGYGNLVDIRHPDGSMTRYAHNSRIFVQVGQEVEQGQTIAAMGSTGFSTGPHTHFEIHKSGKGAINPIALLPKERI